MEQKTTAQVAVVTVKTTRPETIQQFSVRLFDQWKIGQKGKDNGALLVVALEDREAWITTGYGLEGALPDIICSKIVREAMIPYFKNEQYSKGIQEGVMAIGSFIAKEYNVEIAGQKNYNFQKISSDNQSVDDVIELIAIIVFFILIFCAFALFGAYGRGRTGYRSGGGSSGGSGGGFGGFGGGSTGGGGGGGKW